MMGFILGIVVGMVAMTIPRIYKWGTKQVNDAKTHIPGA